MNSMVNYFSLSERQTRFRKYVSPNVTILLLLRGLGKWTVFSHKESNEITSFVILRGSCDHSTLFCNPVRLAR